MTPKKFYILCVLFLNTVTIKSEDQNRYPYSFNLEHHITDITFRTKREYNGRSVVSQYLSTILENLDADKHKQLQFLQKIKAQFGQKIYQELVEKYKLESEIETEPSESSDSDTSQTPTQTFVFCRAEGSNRTPADFDSPEKIKYFKGEVRRRNKDRSTCEADFLSLAEQNALELFSHDQVLQSYYIQAQALFPEDELLQYYYTRYGIAEAGEKDKLLEELQKEGATKEQYHYFIKTINSEMGRINKL